MRSTFLLVMSLALVLAVSACARVQERREARETEAALASTTAAATTVLEAPQDGPSPMNEAQAARATAPAAPPALQNVACAGDATRGTTVRTLTSDGVERSYRLYVPASYDPAAPMALVLNFHGFGGSAQQQERGSGFNAVAERKGFVVATPDGTNRPQRWYIYGRWERGYVDDFAFVEDLIDDVSASICFDPTRIYATGMSNGAGMSSLLACRSDRIAAIGPVAGSPYSEALCRNAGPVPVIAFHGTDDTLVPFNGGNGGRLGLPVTPVRENMRAWAVHNGCNLALQTERIASDVVLERYTSCNEGADVLLYVIEGGGHTWPGADRELRFLGRTTQSIEASELIWKFFAAH